MVKPSKNSFFVGYPSAVKGADSRDRLEDLPESECACAVCQAMCAKPCWPTPEEAEALMRNGFAKRLMLDYWVASRHNEDIELLCPAHRGCEGKPAPFMPTSNGGCTFFENGLCLLHNRKLKPIGGRVATCKRQVGIEVAHMIATKWDTDKGREIVAKWKKLVNYK